MSEQKPQRRNDIVAWMREASPYIRAHRGEICVVYIGGEALNDTALEGLIQDLILLRGLGLKLVIVHGARPQIDTCCREAGLEQPLLGNLRVTDAATLVPDDGVVRYTLDGDVYEHEGPLDVTTGPRIRIVIPD